MLNVDKVGQIAELQQRAYHIRQHALRMGQVQGQGYVGQALGAADLLAVSYFHAMKYQPENPEWEGRDRFYLSIGHYAIALYAALIEAKLSRLKNLKPTVQMTVVYRCRVWLLHTGYGNYRWLIGSWSWNCSRCMSGAETEKIRCFCL